MHVNIICHIVKFFKSIYNTSNVVNKGSLNVSVQLLINKRKIYVDIINFLRGIQLYYTGIFIILIGKCWVNVT